MKRKGKKCLKGRERGNLDIREIINRNMFSEIFLSALITIYA